MKVHRLLLKDFRGVEHRELHLPEAGVVVLEGANEVGKTSVVEALDMLLTEKHSSRKSSVLAVKPVHRDAPTCVEAELSCGPYRFTYRKQWHSRPATALTVSAPRREQLTGEEAHARVLAILAETLDEGLWRALRLLQGAPLDTSVAGSAALAAALDAAAGGSSGGDRGDGADGAEDLLERVAARRAEFLTASGRPTARFRACGEELERAVAERDAAARALAEVAADVERHAALVAERARLREHRDRTAAEADGQRAAVAALEELRTRVRAGDEVVAQRARAAEEARAAVERRRERAEDAARRAGELARQEEQLVRLRAAEEEAAALTARLEEARAAAGEDADAARTAWSRARAAARAAEDAETLRRLAARLAAHEAAERDVAAARAALGGLLVGEALLRRVEEADEAVRVARAAAEAAAPRVVVEALADGRVLLAGEVLPAGTREATATGELEVAVDGLVRVRVVPGGGARDLAETVAGAERGLRAVLAEAGVADAAAARGAAAERRAAEGALALARQRHAAVGDVAQDRAEHERLLAERATAGEDDGGDGDGGRDGSAAAPGDVGAAREAERAARAAEEEARGRLDGARAAVAEARARREGLAAGVRGGEATLRVVAEEAERAAGQLARDRDGAPDEALAEAAAAAAAALEEARAQLSGARAELDARERGAADTLLAHAEAVLARADEDLRRTEADLATLTVRLELVGREGRQAALDAVETTVEALAAEHAALARRAAAADLLHEVLARHRAAARRRYVAPFRDKLRTLGRLVFGDTFDVELDDDLRVASRELHGRTVRWEQLSTGAREQLAVLVRLACASLVSPEDGVPVVLDDALGHSDPERLRRLGAVLGLVAPPAQVLVMAPGPGVHSSVPAATVVRLSH
ncbi:AAA family ATPase [Kineococcus terrestris]|uniref:AAA family ATPase n=1 Tax=Kineococcus terrestris TaxID=2044856 RepID=UPI0034DB3AEC